MLLLIKAIHHDILVDQQPPARTDPRGQWQRRHRDREPAAAGRAEGLDERADPADRRRDRRQVALYRRPLPARAGADPHAGGGRLRAEGRPVPQFQLSEEEWEAVDIGSWLHDCGKVTTPEYVVDKATKLETIYDRIHEVRMRFEVLKRDARSPIGRRAPRAAMRMRCSAMRTSCARWTRISPSSRRATRAASSWTRRARAAETDRRAALAPHARRPPRLLLRGARAQGAHGGAALPVEEQLLADRDDHIVAARDTR